MLPYPHRSQGFDYDCGATAVLTVLHYYGININEQGVFDAVGTDKDGTSNEGIEEGMRKLGVKYENVHSLADIDSHIEQGHPVVICWATYPRDWHYSVIIGQEGRDYIVSDPWVTSIARASIDIFDKIWYEADGTRWGIAVMGEPKYTGEIMPNDIRLAMTREFRRNARIAAITERITARETPFFNVDSIRRELEVVLKRVRKWEQGEKESVEGGWATHGIDFTGLEHEVLKTIRVLG